jgi:hypothetical protein
VGGKRLQQRLKASPSCTYVPKLQCIQRINELTIPRESLTDRRGKNACENGLSSEVLELLKNSTEIFPTKETHYMQLAVLLDTCE